MGTMLCKKISTGYPVATTGRELRYPVSRTEGRNILYLDGRPSFSMNNSPVSMKKESILEFLRKHRFISSSIGSIIVALLVSAFSEECTSWFGARGICYILGVDEKKDAIGRLSITLAAALSVWGVWEARRRANAMIETAREQGRIAKGQAKIARITEEGRTHDRFKNAIDHLGHADRFVRMAGVHALRNLSSEQEGQRKLILSILCSRILDITSESKYQKDYKKKPSHEIQTMMHVLFERTDENEEPWKGLSADLSKGYFCGLELENAQFQGAKLGNAQFQGAKIQGAEFQGANLRNAQFQRAYLLRAQFQGAKLGNAQFQGAPLLSAQFQEAELGNAQFQGAYLLGAQFQGANLLRAQFQGAHLLEAQFQGAYLMYTQFQGCMSQYPVQWRDSFSKQIMQCIGNVAELSGAIFADGIQQEEFDRMVEELENIKEMSPMRLDAFRNAVRKHVGKPARRGTNGVPKQYLGNLGLGTYTKAKVDQCIASYEESMKTAASPDEA